MAPEIRIIVQTKDMAALPQDAESLQAYIDNYLPGTRIEPILEEPKPGTGGFGILTGILIYIGKKFFDKLADHLLDWIEKTLTSPGGNRKSIKLELKDDKGNTTSVTVQTMDDARKIFELFNTIKENA
jgi:hypothetical protein